VTAYGQAVIPVLAAELLAKDDVTATLALPHTWGLLSVMLAHTGGALVASLQQHFRYARLPSCSDRLSPCPQKFPSCFSPPFFPLPASFFPPSVVGSY